MLARRTISVLDDNEPFTEDLPVALRTLADAVRTLHRELAHGTDPRRTRQLALAAVGQAADAYRAGLGFSGDVVVAQVRSIATDLVAGDRDGRRHVDPGDPTRGR